jgi:hypothetical protein
MCSAGSAAEIIGRQRDGRETARRLPVAGKGMAAIRRANVKADVDRFPRLARKVGLKRASPLCCASPVALDRLNGDRSGQPPISCSNLRSGHSDVQLNGKGTRLPSSAFAILSRSACRARRSRQDASIIAAEEAQGHFRSLNVCDPPIGSGLLVAILRRRRSLLGRPKQPEVDAVGHCRVGG